jgi:hypothetical protein
MDQKKDPNSSRKSALMTASSRRAGYDEESHSGSGGKL